MLHNLLLYYPYSKTLLAVFILTFLVFVAICPFFIRSLKRLAANGQPIRELGPKNHLKNKKGTPTMGGLLILLVFSVATIFFGKLSDALTFPIFAITILFGIIGFYDDYLKVKQEKSAGLPGKLRLFLQFLIAFIVLAVVFLNKPLNLDTKVYIPLFEHLVDLGWFYFIFAAIVIVGTANAVNLTDGLDGLVSVPLIFAFSFFIIEIWYASHFGKNFHLSQVTYLQLFNLSIILTIVVATLFGFLVYNCKPAQVFMGDTGSLALGGLLGTVAVILNHELTLIFLGLIFVVEALSVIIQVLYYKYSGGKRIFKMAPIHHHFELLGHREEKIVVRFWVFSFVLLLLTFFLV